MVKVDLQILRDVVARGYNPKQMDTKILWEMVRILTERKLNGIDVTAPAMGTLMTVVHHIEQLEAQLFTVISKDDNLH